MTNSEDGLEESNKAESPHFSSTIRAKKTRYDDHPSSPTLLYIIIAIAVFLAIFFWALFLYKRNKSLQRQRDEVNNDRHTPVNEQPIAQEIPRPQINRQSTVSVEAEHLNNYDHHQVYQIGNIGNQMQRNNERVEGESEPLLER